MVGTLTISMKRSAPAWGSPLLTGCSDGAEAVAMGLVGLAALFVLLLFTLPPVLRYLDHRGHRNRMVNRRPWSDDAAQRPKSRRRKDA